MSIIHQRGEAVRATLDRIRAAGIHEGENTPEQIEAAKAALVDLAGRVELFPEEQFPFLYERRSGFYRLSEDADHRNALYVQVSRNGIGNQPHRHPHWAIIVGIQGNELNRLYRRVDDESVPFRGKLESIGDVAVEPGVALYIPEERYHTIEIAGEQPGIHLHFYAVGADTGSHRGVPRFLSPDSEDYIIREDAIHQIGVQRIGHDDIARAEASGRPFRILDFTGTSLTSLGGDKVVPVLADDVEAVVERLSEDRNEPLILAGDGDTARTAAAKLARLGYNNSFWLDRENADHVAWREVA